jgi:hypothetical protein
MHIRKKVIRLMLSIDSGEFLYQYFQNIQAFQVNFFSKYNGPLHDDYKYRQGPFDDRYVLFSLQERYKLQDQINIFPTQ